MTSAEALAATYARAFQHSRAWAVSEFQALLDRPTTMVFGDARSFLILQVILVEAEVITLATDPGHQQQGLAAAHLSQAIAHGQSQGWDRVFLDVAEDNAPARALYNQLAFQTIGRRKAYYRRKDGAQIDALILEKQL